MANTLLIFDKTTNRIVYWAEWESGVPVLPDDFPDYEESTQDYVVCMNEYDEDDWDESTGQLTSAALTKYGIAAGEVAKYLKDVEIEAVNDQYVWDATNKVVQQQPQSIDEQRKYLVVELVDPDTINKPNISQGTGPGGINEVPSMYYDFLKFDFRTTDDLESSFYFNIRVRQYKADGTLDSSSTDTITIIAGKGLVTEGTTSKALSGGEATFKWIPLLDQGLVTLVASSSGSRVKTGIARYWIKESGVQVDDKKRRITGVLQFHIPSTVSTTGGPASDGVYGRWQFPARLKAGSSEYTPELHIASVSVFAQVGSTGDSCIFRLQGLTSGHTYDITLPAGQHYVNIDNINDTGWSPGEIIVCKVTKDDGSAQDVDIYITLG
jgi:hypothetical protein